MCSIPGLPSAGSNVTVIITRVNVNPVCVVIEFWGNFVHDQKIVYQQMKKEIQFPGKALHEGEGKPGDLCLVRVYETWYRARIVSRNDAHYNVFLIDEGQTLQAHTSCLAWGQTNFFNLSPEVEFCILSNVLPVSTHNRWSKLALEFIKTFCGKSVPARVLDFAIPQRAFLLDIPCLSTQMHEMGFAKKLSNEEFKAFVLGDLRCGDCPVEPLGITSVGFEPIKRVCYMYPELQGETTEAVLVTEVNNPQRVFCQLRVFSQELKKLTEQITLHYERTTGCSFAAHENLGTPCASRGADGKWYRSVLQQVLPTNRLVEVLHVDYGRKQIVSEDHVRPLAPEFFRMPVVTYVCSLLGIIDQGVGWTVSQIDYLKSLLLNRTATAKFEYQSVSEGVYYVTIYGDENTNINKLFASREKCSIDSMCLKDYTLHKTGDIRGDSQRCHISVETQETESLKGIFTESLSPNTDHVAVVQHVDSPSKFWIQTLKYAAEFDTLMNGLTELYSDSSGAGGLIRKPEAGLLCVAKAEDGVFYRAVVCKVVETNAEVFFLDYGNKEWVECSNLREFPLGYQNIPALAIKCALYGIQPRNEKWDLNATIFFAKAVVDKVLDVHVVSKSQDTYLVRVIDSVSCGVKDFSKLLCNAGFADMKAMEEPTVASCTKLTPTPDLYKIGASSRSSSYAFKEYFFPIGSSFDVTVSYIESPNDFWCQKVNDAKCMKLLMQDLQRHYANSEFQPILEAACVARHPENGMWCRALVIEKLQASSVTVLFVDYGETKPVPIHDLRRIDPVFLQLKGQAFRCCLYTLRNSVSYSFPAWSPEAMMYFREFVDSTAAMNAALKCTVYAVMCDSQKVMFNVVDLESPFQSICQLLVQRGLSLHASEPVSLPLLRLDSYFYSTHGIKTGTEEDVCITSVKNVSHFFCHLQRHFMQIAKLADKVNSLCRQMQGIYCSETFENMCFAKYTDGLWYRGQFKSTKPSVVVHFVDYGYTQQVKKSDLLPVPIKAAEIMAIPVQAIECGLSDVPETISDELNIWFKSFATHRHFKALVVAKEPSGKVIVQLYDGKTPVNAIIREKFHGEFEQNKHISVKEADDKEKRQSYGVVENQKVPRWTSEKHRRPQKGADSEEVSQQYFDGKMEKNVSPVNVKHTGRPIIPKQTLLPVKVVKPGLQGEVFISHCNSHLSFFVQLVTDESSIHSLVEKMNEEESSHVPVIPGDLREGDLVCAVYPEDNCWYRAVVRKAPAGDTADVEFIDFGNTAEVLVSQICLLDKMFFQPRYSIHCSLTGEVKFDCGETSSFKTYIEKISDRFLCKFIRQVDSVWEVELEVNGKLLGPSVFSETDAVTVTRVPMSPDTDLNLCAYLNPDVSTGQMIAVYASVIIGPQFFWCQYAKVEKLQEISDVIQKIGSHLESRDLNVKTLPIGSGCMALFEDDQVWYRAQVTSGDDDDALCVLFVDYGNESNVKMCDVRPLPAEVSDIPPQAFACQLDGFNVLEGSWDNKAADQFFELINDRLLKVTIVKLSDSSNMMIPHSVKLECEGQIINDVMKNCWIQNSILTLPELANAPSVTCVDLNATSCLRVNKPIDDPLSANPEELHMPSCIYSLETQEEPIGTLSKHELQADFTELPQNISVDVKDTNLNTGVHQRCGPAAQEECLLHSTDLNIKDSRGSLKLFNENQLEPVKTASLEGQTCDQAPENVYKTISEIEESKKESDHEIIKSDLGNLRRASGSIAAGSDCAIWSHVYRRWCRAQTVKISAECTWILLLDQDLIMMVDPMNIFEIVQEESLQDEKEMEHGAVICVASQAPSVIDHDDEADKKLVAGLELEIGEKQAQNIELDSCFNELVTESGSMDPKEELARNLCSSVVQVESEGSAPPAGEQRAHLSKTGDQEDVAETVLNIVTVMSQKLGETEHKGLACFSSEKPAGINEQPVSGVDLVITENQFQDKEPDSCSEPMPDDVTQGSDLSHETPREMNKMCVTDVSGEQIEPAMEIRAPLEVPQDPCCAVEIQVQTVEDPEAPIEEQEVEHVTKTFEHVDELMDFIPVLPLQKDQEAESEAEAGLDTFGAMPQQKTLQDDAVLEVCDMLLGEPEQGSDTSDLITNMVESEPTADDAPFSDLQEPPDSEELRPAVTHLTHSVVDTSDDIIFVKEWQLSTTEENEPSSRE